MSVDRLEKRAHDRKIFNHDIRSCIYEDTVGNHLYSGRALGLTGQDDLIQIHPFLKGEWQAITDHYDRIGLPHSKNVLWDISLDRMSDYPDLRESVYRFGPSENRARRNRSWEQTVAHINDRNNFIALASQLRLDVPHTHCFHGKQWFAGIDYFPYPCYLKPANPSVVGKGIHRCENPSDLIKALAYFDEDVPLQVQEEIHTDIFLNLQYAATDQGIRRSLATERVSQWGIYEGDRYPAKCQPWGSVEPMAQWLWQRGIRGVFAFDVAVVQEIDGLRFVLISCNPHYNEVSYFAGIARRLRIPQWIAKEFSGDYDRLTDIDLRSIEFSLESRSGIVVVNWGTILIGKLGVLIAGTLIEQKQLETKLLERLGYSFPAGYKDRESGQFLSDGTRRRW